MQARLELTLFMTFLFKWWFSAVTKSTNAEKLRLSFEIACYAGY